MKYKAFISYKHSENGRRHAQALETALKRFAKPTLSLPMRIFRDEKHMKPDVSLNRLVREGLNQSEYLIFLAEQSSSASQWCCEELEYWCGELKRTDNLLIVQIGDEISVDGTKSINFEQTTALPRLLERYVTSIPLYIDFRWAQTASDASIQDPRYRHGINSLVARLRGVNPEDLNDEELRVFRRNISLRNTAIFVLLIMLFISVWASYLAFKSQKEAVVARDEAVNQRVRADSSAQVATLEKVRADSSARVALEQKAIAIASAAEAENNLQRAEEEELRAKSALDQVKKEKEATEAQRLRAEDNYRIAQAKTEEAESAKEEAERNLENLQKSNESVVKSLLQNAKEKRELGEYREALKKIELADEIDVLLSEVADAYLDNITACLANAPDYGLALGSVSRANQTGVLSRDRMYGLYLDMADNSVLNLHYDTAMISIRLALTHGAPANRCATMYFDLSYWYCEVGKLDRSLALLDSAYILSGRELSVSGVADTVSLHHLMSELSRDRYSMLHARYYPSMVDVSGGTFDMGDVLYGDKTHRVTLSSFRISATEVTVFQYGLYCALNEGNDIRKKIEWPNSGDNPVVNVSWYDAVLYSNWLSERMGLRRQYDIDGDKVDANNQNSFDDLKWTVTRLRGSDGYRLPTESEWEYAARGGIKGGGNLYAGGDSLDLVGWYGENSGNRTHSVGAKLANEFGLYDMSGSVWEWCWDWFGGYDGKAQTNPQGAERGDYRVFRGGSWNFDPESCRAANRYLYGPTLRINDLGFRLASPLQ